MARRRMTLRRIDPWSVLKFGLVLNLCLLAIALLGAAIVWWVVNRLGLIEQACDLATDVGFEQCGVNGGNLFRLLLLLGALGVVIQTALYVFGAFLHNLIADLIGGVGVTLVEEGGGVATTRPSPTGQAAVTPSPSRPRRSDAAPTERRPQHPPDDTVAVPPIGSGSPRAAEGTADARPERSPEAPRTPTSDGDRVEWPWERDRVDEPGGPPRRSDERLFGDQ